MKLVHKVSLLMQKSLFQNHANLKLHLVSAIRSLFLSKFTDFCKKQTKKCVLLGDMDFEANFEVQKVVFQPNLLSPYLLVNLGGGQIPCHIIDKHLNWTLDSREASTSSRGHSRGGGKIISRCSRRS